MTDIEQIKSHLDEISRKPEAINAAWPNDPNYVEPTDGKV